MRSAGWSAISGADASLLVATPTDEALCLGAFQRPCDAARGRPLVRRGSGGGVVALGGGTLWVQLSLFRADALVPCTADKLLNRYVRPLLRAITRVANVPASYFGRDWISVNQHPVGFVGFGHDGASGRALFEAVIGVNQPFALEARSSFRGKAPTTLAEAAGRAIDADALRTAITAAYASIASETHDAAPPDVPADTQLVDESPVWSATREEAIGIVAAGRDASGKLRVGGELMASRDAIARLEDRIAALGPSPSLDAIGQAVDTALEGTALFGVRSLRSIRDVIAEALSPR